MNGGTHRPVRFTRKKSIILPARFDDTPVPGMTTTVAFQDLRHTTPEQLVDRCVSTGFAVAPGLLGAGANPALAIRPAISCVSAVVRQSAAARIDRQYPAMHRVSSGGRGSANDGPHPGRYACPRGAAAFGPPREGQ